MAETSRSSSGAGTSTARRSGPTTGWWPTPDSSPWPGSSTPDRMNATRRRGPRGGRRRGLRRVPRRVHGPGAVVARAVDRARGRAPAHAAPRALAHRQHPGRAAARRRVAAHRARADRPHHRAWSPARRSATASRCRTTSRRSTASPAACSARSARSPCCGCCPGAALDAGLAGAARRATRASSPRSTATHRTSRVRARIVGRIVGEAPYPLFDDARGRRARRRRTDAGPRVDTARRAVGRARPRRGVRARARPAPASRSRPTSSRPTRTWWRGRPDTIGRHRRRRPARRDASCASTAVTTSRSCASTAPPLPRARRSVRRRSAPSRRCSGTRTAATCAATPARVVRRIDTPRTDIYRSGTIQTSIVGLAAHLIVGDSGAPVVGADGQVQAMVFAVDPADADTAFAISSEELAPFVRRPHAARDRRRSPTGACLVD